MKKEIYKDEFMYEMKSITSGFSYNGLSALYDFLDEYNDFIFDGIAINCDFTEYENINEFWANYGREKFPTIKELQDRTTTILVGDNGFIIQNF